MSEVTQKSDIYSCQMRLLGGTPHIPHMYIHVNICSARTCIISRGDTFVVTGGGGDDGRATDRVSLYSSSDGWVRDLASLNTVRQRHGCASFTDSNGQEVRMSSRTHNFHTEYPGAAGGGGLYYTRRW